MIDVVIHGWNIGMNTIESARILRRFLGLGLAEAKTMVESIVDDRELQVQLPDFIQAEAFCCEAAAFGMKCRIERRAD